MLYRLTEAQCRAAMAAGDFRPEISGSAPVVAIVLTQSWCPQWAWMSAWLGPVAGEAGVDVWQVEYDREPFFEEFMAWKEGVLGNDHVPYIRYYRAGKLARESNYIDRQGFRRHIGLLPGT